MYPGKSGISTILVLSAHCLFDLYRGRNSTKPFSRKARETCFSCLGRTRKANHSFDSFDPRSRYIEYLRYKSELACCNSLRDLTSLRGGTMRNFDFLDLRSTVTRPDELPPSGLQNLLFKLSPGTTAVQVQRDRVPSPIFLPLIFQLFNQMVL